MANTGSYTPGHDASVTPYNRYVCPNPPFVKPHCESLQIDGGGACIWQSHGKSSHMESLNNRQPPLSHPLVFVRQVKL